MDRLTSITTFVRVVQNGGFSAAGRRMSLSTPVVSNHVRTLEDHLGVRLLNRTTRKVSLTEAGKSFYERCTRILADLESAEEIAGALHSTTRGTLRIYTTTSMVPFVSMVATEFLSRNPEANVDVQMGERTIDLIDEGYDIEIRLTQPPDSSLIVRSLATWRHVLCCSESYIANHGRPAHLSDLTQHNCLRNRLYPFSDGWHFTHREGKPISVKVSGNVITNSGETQRIALLQGVGIGLAAGFIVREDLEAGRLLRLLPDYRPVEFSMIAVYPNRHQMSAKVRAFIDLLVKRSAQQQTLINPYA